MRGVKIIELRFYAWLALFAGLLCPGTLAAQKGKSVNLLEFKYGVHFPGGDLGNRFGTNNDIGISLQSVRMGSKIFFGLEGYYLFGNMVKEDVLYRLRTYDGSILGVDGLPGDINLKERGSYIGINGGKIIPTTKFENKLTGIRLQAGIGLLQHKIRVQDNSQTVIALRDEYLPGYDRLTNGAALHLGVGYQYQSPTNNFQFHIMADLYGAQTASRRDFDYAEGAYLEGTRMDWLSGFSLAYVVSISRVSKPENIYY